MVRKERKMIAEEVKKLVQRLSQEGDKTIKHIDIIAGLNRNAVSKIILDLPTFTLLPSVIQTSNERIQRVTQEDQIIRNIILCQNEMTQQEMTDGIFVKTGVRKYRSAICRNFKKQGIMHKRLSLIPEEPNTAEKNNLRSIYAVSINRYFVENIVFLDETGFIFINQDHMVTPNMIKRLIGMFRPTRGVNLSCLCVISYDGLVAYEMKRGAYNSELFNKFIERELDPYLIASRKRL